MPRVIPLLIIVIGVPFPEIAFERHEHELHALAVFGNFSDPLGFDVFEGVSGVDLVRAVISCWLEREGWGMKEGRGGRGGFPPGWGGEANAEAEHNGVGIIVR